MRTIYSDKIKIRVKSVPDQADAILGRSRTTHHQPHNNQHQQKDALPSPRVLPINRSLLQLLHRTLHLPPNRLDVVLHRIQQRPLLDDHVAEVAEEVCELGDGLGDGREFLGALVDLRVEGVGVLKLGLGLELGLYVGRWRGRAKGRG